MSPDYTVTYVSRLHQLCPTRHSSRRLAARLNSDVRQHQARMVTDQDKRKAVRDQIRIVQQILRRWDPIGVIVDPTAPDNPLDEYDSYAPVVLGKLQAGAGIEELTQHLYGLTTERMGLHGDRDRDRLFAGELVSWWVSRPDRSDAA